MSNKQQNDVVMLHVYDVLQGELGHGVTQGPDVGTVQLQSTDTVRNSNLLHQPCITPVNTDSDLM